MNMNGMRFFSPMFPQPMEIAFSLDAGSFSCDLFDYGQQNMPAQFLRNAFVLCFENALIPIKWMAERMGLRASVKGIQEAKQRAIRNPYLQESLARIEQAVLQLLSAISAHGPVCILSEESAQFVELVCQTFFPRLAYCLSSPQMLVNVQVIGAPKKFVSTTEKTAWRVTLLQSLIRDRLYAGATHQLMDMNTGRFGLLVVSPHQVDVFASSKALEVAPFVIPKSVRLVNSRALQIDQFALHLQTLSQYLCEAAQCTTAFTVSL